MRGKRQETCELHGTCSPRDAGKVLTKTACVDFHRVYRKGEPRNGVTEPPQPCKNLGEPIGETVECATCSGKTQLKLFACSVHGKCTIDPNRPVPGVANCQCDKYKAKPRPSSLVTPTVRNLLFHVWPTNDMWRWNVEQLLRRMPLFNGRRIVAVVTDHTTVPPKEVEKAFQGNIDDMIVVPNDPAKREVVTFLPLWNSVKSIHPSHVTFYCHGKGVSPMRQGSEAVKKWTEINYSVNLDRWQKVEEILGTHPVCGAFKKTGHGWAPHESMSTWHYSGSFYWFRNKDVFSKDWQRIDQFWSGIEPWPSLHFNSAQAGCIFHARPVPEMNLYDDHYVQTTIIPEYEKWLKSN